MPGSSAFRWINTDAVRGFETLTDQFHQMANLELVTDCAKRAGQVVKTAMQDYIYTQPILRPYADVAERIAVWGEPNDNVWVGVPGDDPVAQRAHDMDMLFPVLHATFETQRQSGQAAEAFETCLIERVF
jgi:hypothetical protein